MTFLGPVGQAPTGPALLDQRVGRGGLFAAVGVLAALNAQADQITDLPSDQSLIGLIAVLGAISAVIWFAMFAALKIGLEDETRYIRSRDTAVAIACTALCFLPVSFAAKAGLVLAGFYLFLTSGVNSPSRRVSLILLALTGTLVWGRVLLTSFAAPILSLDAHIVGGVIGSHVHGNLVDLRGTNSSIVIEEPCSSVHNISIAVVLWATAAALFKVRLDKQYIGVGLAMVAWMFALNIARLAAIGLYPDHYQYLHFGAGAALFGWAALIGAALLAGLGVIHAVERQQ